MKYLKYALIFLCLVGCTGKKAALENFWNGKDVASRENFADMYQAREVFEKYCGLLTKVDQQCSQENIDSFLAAASADTVSYIVWIDLFIENLYPEDSPCHSDDLMEYVCEKSLESGLLDQWHEEIVSRLASQGILLNPGVGGCKCRDSHSGENYCEGVKILPDECWWGLATDLGPKQPFTSEFQQVDLKRQNFNNQTCPLLLSNKGRYIWSNGPFTCNVEEGVIKVSDARSKIYLNQAKDETLRGAYLAAYKRHFSPRGSIPPELFFARPQYNTWIELVYNQNQADIIKYAKDLLANGFPSGVLMIDDNWQKYYGNFEFKPDKFPNPKGMVDQLHRLGFKVMLWICPFVSPDSPEYRELEAKGYLVKTAEGSRPAVLNWWNGQSACYDLSNPMAYDYLKAQLIEVQEKYGIDGFKFDAGDPERYLAEDVSVYDGTSIDVEQTMLWAQLGSEFEYNEFRACWRMGGEALVQRLGDKSYSWKAVASLVPSMIQAGLLGYAYACPDMIGGGEFGSFIGIDPASFDQSLIVRSCQIHSMMPMMQFSVAPWRILSRENLAICHKYAKLHEQMGPYIVAAARVSAQTGEPIVRHMAYAFPDEGFEDCKDQYMLGEKYLVAPVLTPENSRSVRLPAGLWRDDLGEVHEGGKTLELDVPLDRLPYFEKL